jgi:thiol-disulfide isomerase/thioredoxin
VPHTLIVCISFFLSAAASNSARGVWDDLKDKRTALAGAHQEFEVSQTFHTRSGTQSSKRQVTIDMSGEKWRETSVSGSGNRIRIFDGKDVLVMEEGGTEFVRTKHRDKDEESAPAPYGSDKLDWSKATERERRSCQMPGRTDVCAVLEIPLKPWTRLGGSAPTRMLQGSDTVMIDVENGLILARRTLQAFDNGRGGYKSETAYSLKRMTYGGQLDAALFRFPGGDMREVKELPRWNAAKIKKELAGKTAPELAVSDIQGTPVTLSALKGKVVLLDFWTTWCGPCRADGPALDKLYAKYGVEDLVIIAISVSEERATVENFLKEHPHKYPIILTSENEMPRPYQVAVFPTYVIVDRDGAIGSAAEGDQGFSELRRLLKKSGLEVD